MNKITKILIERDGMTREEAEKLIAETREEILSSDHLFEVEDIIMDNLGLEPDYIFDLI